jgi:hypothetical protein
VSDAVDEVGTRIAELARVLQENSRGPIRPLAGWPKGLVCRVAYREQTRRLELIQEKFAKNWRPE